MPHTPNAALCSTDFCETGKQDFYENEFTVAQHVVQFSAPQYSAQSQKFSVSIFKSNDQKKCVGNPLISEEFSSELEAHRSVAGMFQKIGVQADVTEPIIIATHDGEVHADEVVAISLLKKHYATKGIQTIIVRTRDQAIIDAATVAIDVGGAYNPEELRFDHHQDKSATKASAGLIGDFLQSCGVNMTAKRGILNDIDKADLGLSQWSKTSERVAFFNPAWNEQMPGHPDTQFYAAMAAIDKSFELADKAMVNRVLIGRNIEKNDYRKAFRAALGVNSLVLKRQAVHEQSKKEGQAVFLDAARQAVDGVASISTGALPYQEVFTAKYLSWQKKEIRSIIEGVSYIKFPTRTGDNGVIAAPSPEDPFKPKTPFPWTNKRGQDLINAINESGGNVNMSPGANPNSYFCLTFFLTGPKGDDAFIESALAQAKKLTPSCDSLAGATQGISSTLSQHKQHSR